ncbi:VRR-NUC domain-containing protein [Vararia minispora EC-137]|uniref:VRR-NUC domain-containing protein n=1 Tax=Vararia minispora EC-137 TaxID=1314806 RepID=A0ACB8QQS0_9AGAM|nr:VRR-NUC domain-containing protein [Vararia minispora EC-137]
MSPGSPGALDATSFVYGHTRSQSSTSDDEGASVQFRIGEEDTKEAKNVDSMYVKEFEYALIAVLEYERHLFNQPEIDFLKMYNNLHYSSKYILVRLCLRSHRWLRRSKLDAYRTELGNDFEHAIQSLCKLPYLPDLAKKPNSKEPQVKPEGPQISALTLNFEEEKDVKPNTRPYPLGDMHPSLVSLSSPSEPDLSFFLEGAKDASMKELLHCLTVDELKDVAKKFQVSPKAKRDILINSLLNVATPMPKLKSPKDKYKQTKLHFGGEATASSKMRQFVMDKLGICIRLNRYIFDLMRRIDIIYFRSTSLSSGMLTPAVMGRAGRWNYAITEYKRTADIWPSRQAILDYERAIHIQADMEFIMNPEAPGATFSGRFSHLPLSREEIKALLSKNQKPDDNSYLSPGIVRAKLLKYIFDRVWPEWQAIVKATDGEPLRPYGLYRFEHGHILTRIVHKGADALATLKERKLEVQVLDALLAQNRWQRGRRGAWYDRMALIFEKHLDKSRESKLEALRITKAGLEDTETHLIYRDKLDRRLHRLENSLKLQKQDLHQCEGNLEKPRIVTILGRHPACPAENVGPPLSLDETRRPKGTLSAFITILPKAKNTRSDPSQQKPSKPARTGRTEWVGKTGDVVGVETLALQHYEQAGYSGYHCEGGIIRTLFGILFWDIIFMNIPGAFETKYQLAPLDLGEETFVLARADAIAARLVDIRKGRALKVFENVDAEHRAKQTSCVGVNWNYSTDELREILQAGCFDGKSLTLICEVLCQDYVKRSSGLPDLFLWHTQRQSCKLVEVKSPNDSLQENQKVWIDVLNGAGVDVELCSVRDADAPIKAEPKGNRKKRAAPSKREGSEEEEEEIPFNDGEYEPDPSVLSAPPRKRQRFGIEIHTD